MCQVHSRRIKIPKCLLNKTKTVVVRPLDTNFEVSSRVFELCGEHSLLSFCTFFFFSFFLPFRFEPRRLSDMLFFCWFFNFSFPIFFVLYVPSEHRLKVKNLSCMCIILDTACCSVVRLVLPLLLFNLHAHKSCAAAAAMSEY